MTGRPRVASTRWLTLRVALACGFGLTAAIWLLVALLVSQRVTLARHAAENLSARYVKAQELLAVVRAQVLLTSVIIRDALLDPTARPPSEYRLDTRNGYRAIDEALDRYASLRNSPSDGPRLHRLREEIDGFRTASLDVLSADAGTWQAEARTLLQRIQPKREAVIAVSEELQAINRMDYVAQRDEAADLLATLQHQVLAVLSAAVGISLLIAWAVFRYSVRLEDRLVAQHAREEATAADLQRLSAHVVKAQEEERRRIARELHDEIGQALSAVNLELAAAQQRLTRGLAEDDLLGEARALTDGAIRSVRSLSQLLHPSVLEDLGLGAALRSFLTTFGHRAGLDVVLRDEALRGRLSPDAERTIYRMVQEATTNTARHAGARTVEIGIVEAAGELVVTVEDDGAGFDATRVQRPGGQHGLGLLGIRERLSQLGGTLRIESAPGRGTRLTAHIPLDAARGQSDGLEASLFQLDEVAHG